MIDTTTETPIGFSEAASKIASWLGVATHPKTVYLWATRGYVAGKSRVRLDSLCIGRRRVTSTQAIQRFCEQITAARTPEGDSTGKPARRQSVTKKNEKTKAGLRRHGLI